jgi:H+/Cl- antiporter ClcA
MAAIPEPVKPVIGGLLCGMVGIAFPQILFFGYETLNSLLKNATPLSMKLILSLLAVKLIMTAVAAGSGLVGGTFAPLFLGAMLGGAFHDSVVTILISPPSSPVPVEIGGVPAHAMVSAASVLAALFRAPLWGECITTFRPSMTKEWWRRRITHTMMITRIYFGELL